MHVRLIHRVLGDGTNRYKAAAGARVPAGKIPAGLMSSIIQKQVNRWVHAQGRGVYLEPTHQQFETVNSDAERASVR